MSEDHTVGEHSNPRAMKEPSTRPLSVCVAYLLFCIGGLFGLHHIYLKRPHQSFLWCISFGGFGLGLLHDFFAIPRYVREASGTVQVISMLVFAWHFSWLAKSLLPAPSSPQTQFSKKPGHNATLPLTTDWGDWGWALSSRAASVLGRALAVWAVGNAPMMEAVSLGLVLPSVMAAELCAWGLQVLEAHDAHQGSGLTVVSLVHSLATALLACGSTFGVVAGALYSRSWVHESRHASRWRAAACVVGSVALAWCACACGWYWNGGMARGEGGPHLAWEAMDFMGRMMACMGEEGQRPDYCDGSWDFGQWDVGSGNRWTGKQAPHEVLGVEPGASLQECRAKFRSMALALHPDKCAGCSAEEREERKDKFVQVQEAWEFVAKQARSKARWPDGSGGD